tara:strand:- start:138 stop:536 length:399 start_codon:yes stop_codon:yes gene_type:complete
VHTGKERVTHPTQTVEFRGVSARPQRSQSKHAFASIDWPDTLPNFPSAQPFVQPLAADVIPLATPYRAWTHVSHIGFASDVATSKPPISFRHDPEGHDAVELFKHTAAVGSHIVPVPQSLSVSGQTVAACLI